jgi:hypothetical protein
MTVNNTNTASIFTDASYQYVSNSKVIEHVVRALPGVLMSSGQFKSVEDVEPTFREKGAAAQLYTSTNPEFGNPASIHISMFNDGTIKVTRSARAIEGGQDNSSVEPWNFSFAGNSATEVMREIVVRIATLDQGFAKYITEQTQSQAQPKPAAG